MEIVKDNLNVNVQPFLQGLFDLKEGSQINNYDFNVFKKKVIVNVEDGFDETIIDDLITDNTIEITETEVKIEGVKITSIKEMTKKIKKSSFKNKYIGYSYNDADEEVIFRVSTDWTSQDTENLDSLIEALVGYDVVTYTMEGYEKIWMDGEVFYNRKRSELVTRINDANDSMTSEKADDVRVRLKGVKSEVITGDWVSAKREINKAITELDENDVNYTSTLEVINSYDVEIVEYITTHYPEGTIIPEI